MPDIRAVIGRFRTRRPGQNTRPTAIISRKKCNRCFLRTSAADGRTRRKKKKNHAKTLRRLVGHAVTQRSECDDEKPVRKSNPKVLPSGSFSVRVLLVFVTSNYHIVTAITDRIFFTLINVKKKVQSFGGATRRDTAFGCLRRPSYHLSYQRIMAFAQQRHARRLCPRRVSPRWNRRRPRGG